MVEDGREGEAGDGVPVTGAVVAPLAVVRQHLGQHERDAALTGVLRDRILDINIHSF